MRTALLVALGPLFLLSSSARADTASSKSAAPPQNTQALRDELNEIQKELAQSKSNLEKSHERLNDIRNTPVNQPPPGHAKLAVVYQNDMSSMFIPVRYDVAIDGYNVYSKPDAGNGQKAIEFFRGSLPPGQHQVTITIAMKGNGYGAFAYLKGYKFIAHAGHVFTTTDEKLTQVKIHSIEKPASVPKDRPNIEFQDSTWNLNVPSPSEQ